MPDRITLDAGPTRALEWRPELAGLRGAAIGLVVAFHLGLSSAGGPVGVTVFFVLSGFLITSLLVREADGSGTVALRVFYARRIRRLAPALVTAVLVVFVIAAASGQASAVVGDSLLALTYLANWARVDGDLMGMWNHAWSLAIEEQFYLLWPVAFVALVRFVHPTSWHVVIVLLALAVGSAALRAALTLSGSPDERTYFGSDTRAEALLVGCALACVVSRGIDIPVGRLAGALAVAVIAAWSFLSIPSLWPGDTYTIVAVAAAALIAAALRGHLPALASRPLVWVGERSYSLYLWHVPVILFLDGPLIGLPPGIRILVLTALSAALAAASYSFIEQPFRELRTRGRRPTMSGPRLAVDHPG